MCSPTIHRWLYVSFHIKQLFKASLPEVPDSPQRGLHSNKPNLVEIYSRIVDKNFNDQKAYSMIVDKVNPTTKTADDWFFTLNFFN
jgi:hypothetical protein